jgi:hypothetical protein
MARRVAILATDIMRVFMADLFEHDRLVADQSFSRPVLIVRQLWFVQDSV